MTCVVGLVQNGKVHLAADSLGSSSTGFKNERKDTKLFSNGPFIIGFCGSFRMGQLLRFSFSPEAQKLEQSDYAYMCTTFVNAVRHCFEDGGVMVKEENTDAAHGSFLVAYKGVLYNIESDYQVGVPRDDYDACGSGTQIALGALYATGAIKDPKKRLLVALEAASRYNTGVGGQFVTMSEK